ncbi:MAG: hypothetical protein DRH15_12415 [Deltaproteobacteria bacterium]|nr:MAG: hypothetical protein DRH15_12415 [Deltaproteobacteria bacterium]
MQKERILIIDGDDYVRHTLEQYLENDYLVYTAASFYEALEIFKEIPLDIVITEIDTPEVKGIEILRKFKETRSDISIIVAATYDSIPLAVEAMKEGAYDYVTKPFNFDELKLAILHALERQRLIAEVKKRGLPQGLGILDEATGVYNCKYFDEILKREVERVSRYPQKFSLLIIDVDDFSKHKDRWGEKVNFILKKIAKILLTKTRRTDLPAYLKEDRFALITPHTDKKGVSVVAARIIDLVANEEFVLENKEAKVTVSIGAATFDDDANSAQELIKKAEKVLEEAKKLGKSRLCLFGEKV